MPNIRLSNTTPNIRNRSDILHIRASQGVIQTSTTSNPFGGAGYLIGMMALTYTLAHTTQTNISGGQGLGPNVRISNN